MRVLHCIPSLAGGGAERQLTYLAQELVRIGCEVHVAYVHSGPNMSRLQATGATLHRIAAFSNYDPQILGRLLAMIGRVKPDVVQCWLLQMEVLGGLASALTRTPWVFSERSSDQAYPASVKTWLRVRTGAKATAIVSNSEGGERYWRGQGLPHLRCLTIRNGLPLEEIAAAPTATAEEAGVTSGEPLILTAGRLGPEKNLHRLVEALQMVAATHPAQTICCGEGPLRGHVEQLVADHGLNGRVRMIGYAPNLWRLMKRASMTVSVSLFEGSPNVVLEAMACGCPLVVSDIPAHRELLDSEAALLVDPHQPRQIAEAMVSVLSDPEAAAQRARVAYDRVRGHSLPAMARRYADLYRDLALPRRRRLTRAAL
jgi:glycosyltransferase involved in cell wall biosynthesis